MKIKDRFIGFLKNNWQLKLVSVLLAIVVWFLICEYVDPVTEKQIDNIKISLNYENSVPQSEGLGIMTTIDKTVSIKVSGSRDTIALMDRKKITASVDLSGVTRSGEYDLPIVIDFGRQNLELMDQSLDSVKVKFDIIESKPVNVKVEVNGSVPDGFSLKDPTVKPDDIINVKGPKAILDTIKEARVSITQEKFNVTRTFSKCQYEFLDENGEIVPKTFLTADEENVEVTVTVVQQKTIPLIVEIKNTGGGSANTSSTDSSSMDRALYDINITPKEVTVQGSSEVLENLNSISVGSYDVFSGETIVREESISSSLNGVTVVGDVTTAKVTITPYDLPTKTIMVNKISIENLPKDKKAEIQEKEVAVRVRGFAEDLEKLSAANVSLIADARQLVEGSNTVSVSVILPDDLKVGVFGEKKYEVTVVIS